VDLLENHCKTTTCDILPKTSLRLYRNSLCREEGNSMKMRILAVEYPEENEQQVHEILDSVFFTNMLKRVSNLKSEVTTPYNGEFDAFVNDVICLLISHDEAAKELVEVITERMPHLPGLIKEFDSVRQKLEGEEKRT
jgi:hypothetical protein